MSPTDFTDSHRLLARVCLNLPQISQILTDCWCAFVLIFYDFTDSHSLFVRVCLNLPQISQILYSLEAFRICVNLCNLWELFVVCNQWAKLFI